MSINPLLIPLLALMIPIVAILARTVRRMIEYREGQRAIAPADTGEAQALRGEVKMLKERIAVLERITTDGHTAARIDHEIELLRDR